jgi:hypothetical protein
MMDGGVFGLLGRRVAVDFSLGRAAGMERVGEAMRGWKLQELIDFEVALAAWDGESRPARPIAGEDRGAVMRAWLRAVGAGGPGAAWESALGWAGRLLGWVTLVAGFGAAWSALDRRLEGVHVVVFLAVTLVLPWLVLLGGLAAWVFRPPGGGALGGAMRMLATKFSGKQGRAVMARVEGSPELARVLGWRIAGKLQGAAADFHVGAVVGLWAMVFFRKVGFYWETTTAVAMERTLEVLVRVLSAPWSGWLPRYVPEVAESRRTADWAGGGQDWVMFLGLALVLWGIVPRLLLAGFARHREWRLRRDPAFQSPAQRRLWRVLKAVLRGDEPEGPADGALVIDLGGIGPDREALRPVFLRRLRMNPVAWETLDVLDGGREAAARAALERAPAGVVLLAEAWSLAPRGIEDTLRRVRASAGERRVVLYVADFGPDGKPCAVAAAERTAWQDFIDARAATDVELVIHGEESAWTD